MGGPSWLNAIAAALMLAVAIYAASRLITAPLRRRSCLYDVDFAHVLMGVAMAGMFLPRLRTLSPTIWAVAFGALTVWFLAQSVRTYSRRSESQHATGHYLPHAVHTGAMLYMALAMPTMPTAMPMPAMPGMAGMAPVGDTSARLPTLALVLALFMVGYIVLLTDNLSPRPAAAPSVALKSVALPLLAPRAAAGYKIAMSIGMGYALITML